MSFSLGCRQGTPPPSNSLVPTEEPKESADSLLIPAESGMPVIGSTRNLEDGDEGSPLGVWSCAEIPDGGVGEG